VRNDPSLLYAVVEWSNPLAVVVMSNAVPDARKSSDALKAKLVFWTGSALGISALPLINGNML
jgi:hypothetical protein